KANDLDHMKALWGTERGPASGWMKSEELKQRLTVLQIYLNHVGYRVIEGPLPVTNKDERRMFRVELQRATSCTVVVPIEVGHAVAQVMNARPSLGEEPRDGAIGIARLQQLDVDVAQRQGDDSGAIGRFRLPRLEAKHVPVEGQGGVDRRDGDAHVGDTDARRGHDA